MIRNGYFIGKAKGKKSYDDVFVFDNSQSQSYVFQFSAGSGFNYTTRYNISNINVESFEGNLIIGNTDNNTGNKLIQWDPTTNTVGTTYTNYYTYGFTPAVNPSGDTIVYVKQLTGSPNYTYAIKTSTWVINSGAVSDYTTPSAINDLITDAAARVHFNNTNDGIVFYNSSNVRIYTWNTDTGYGNTATTTTSINAFSKIAWNPDGRTFSVVSGYTNNWSATTYQWNPANSSISILQTVSLNYVNETYTKCAFSPGGNAFIVADKGVFTHMYKFTPGVGIDVNNPFSFPSNFVNRAFIDFVGFNRTGNVIFFVGYDFGGLGTLYAYKWSDVNGIGKLIGRYNDYTQSLSVFSGGICPRGFRPL